MAVVKLLNLLEGCIKDASQEEMVVSEALRLAKRLNKEALMETFYIGEQGKVDIEPNMLKCGACGSRTSRELGR